MSDEYTPESSVQELENKSQTTKNVILGVIDEIKGELERAQHENEALKAELEKARQEYSDLNSRFASLSTELEKNKELEQEIEAIRKAQALVAEERDTMTAERDAILKERDSAIATLKSRDSEIARLQETCSAFEEIQQALQGARNSTRG